MEKLALYSPFQGTSGIAKLIVIPSLIQFPNGAFLFSVSGNWKEVWFSFGIQCVFFLLFICYDERQARKKDDLEARNILLMEEQRYEMRKEMIALKMKNDELLHQLAFMRHFMEREGWPLMGDISERSPTEPVS